MEVKPEIIAIDATISLRPGGKTLDDFYHDIRERYPQQLLMADCSTVEEALHADELGFDFIGTTLVGYTEQSKGDKIEANDFEIIRTILSKVKHRVIAEGNINTPQKAKGKLTVINHVACNNTRDSVELAKHSERWESMLSHPFRLSISVCLNILLQHTGMRSAQQLRTQILSFTTFLSWQGQLLP